MPLDDLSFAFLGEVVQCLVSIVSFPEEAFNIVQVRVWTIKYILTHQDELNNLPIFPINRSSSTQGSIP
jgi:hypothetical protein